MKMNYRQRQRVKRFVFHLTINQISPVDQVNVEMYHREKKRNSIDLPLSVCSSLVMNITTISFNLSFISTIIHSSMKM